MLQIKWRDKALRIRERKGFPTLEDLVVFIERRAEVANDPVSQKSWGDEAILPKKKPKSQTTTVASERVLMRCRAQDNDNGCASWT